MDTRLMRLTWSVIDEAPISNNRNSSIGEQITAFLQHIENKVALSVEERQQIQQYMSDRTHLIKDLYQAQII